MAANAGMLPNPAGSEDAEEMAMGHKHSRRISLPDCSYHTVCALSNVTNGFAPRDTAIPDVPSRCILLYFLRGSSLVGTVVPLVGIGKGSRFSNLEECCSGHGTG